MRWIGGTPDYAKRSIFVRWLPWRTSPFDLLNLYCRRKETSIFDDQAHLLPNVERGNSRSRFHIWLLIWCATQACWTCGSAPVSVPRSNPERQVRWNDPQRSPSLRRYCAEHLVDGLRVNAHCETEKRKTSRSNDDQPEQNVSNAEKVNYQKGGSDR
jgi:hypothetical protein